MDFALTEQPEGRTLERHVLFWPGLAKLEREAMPYIESWDEELKPLGDNAANAMIKPRSAQAHAFWIEELFYIALSEAMPRPQIDDARRRQLAEVAEWAIADADLDWECAEQLHEVGWDTAD